MLVTGPALLHLYVTILLLQTNGGDTLSRHQSPLLIRRSQPLHASCCHLKATQQSQPKGSVSSNILLKLSISDSDIHNIHTTYKEQTEDDGDTKTTVLSQAALIAGTTIGGGFLALPTATCTMWRCSRCFRVDMCVVLPTWRCTFFVKRNLYNEAT